MAPSDNALDGTTVLINALTTGQKLSPGDIWHVLSSSNAKKKPNIRFNARVHIVYHLGVTPSDPSKYSLVDCGANLQPHDQQCFHWYCWWDF
jgi:hypothetical protein